MRTPEEREASRRAPAFKFSCKSGLVAERNHAERAVAVVVVAGGEEELIGVAVCAAALTELNGPNVVNLDGFAACVAEGTEKRAALRIKRVDASAGRIIRDENRVAHRPEIRRGKRDAPWRMERAAEGRVGNQNASGSEGVNKAALGFIEGRIGDPNRLYAVP
jgi:hypothetical protein